MAGCSETEDCEDYECESAFHWFSLRYGLGGRTLTLMGRNVKGNIGDGGRCPAAWKYAAPTALRNCFPAVSQALRPGLNCDAPPALRSGKDSRRSGEQVK